MNADRARVVRSGPRTGRVVALTFDVGFEEAYTTMVLDALQEMEAPATFGMTGRWAEAYPRLARRIVEDGHQLVNHTYGHVSFTGAATRTPRLNSTERARQLDRAERAVQEATGMTMRPWFRPPFGDYDRSVNADVAACGYTYNLLWTVDSLGWRSDSSDAVLDRCVRRATDGAIYIFHVDSHADAAALPQILTDLRRRGYSFRTVEGLMQS
jgi:peptidoglycan-N-acetylglucosamine deacetylase